MFTPDAPRPGRDRRKRRGEERRGEKEGMRAHSRQAASGKSVGTHLEQGHQRRASRLGNPCDVRHAKRGEVVERAVASSSRVCGSSLNTDVGCRLRTPTSDAVFEHRRRTPSSNTVVGHRRRTPSLNTDDTHLVAPAPPPRSPSLTLAHPRSPPLTPREFPAPSATSASPPCTHAFTPRESRVESLEYRKAWARTADGSCSGSAATCRRCTHCPPISTTSPTGGAMQKEGQRRTEGRRVTTPTTCHHPDDVSPPRRPPPAAGNQNVRL